MEVILLSPHPERIAGAIEASGDQCVAYNGPPETMPPGDFIVSYGYRRIIKGDLLARMAGRIINIHISLLPWNRGADPNFWSWFDVTPKGVTIHQMDSGIDTGDILADRDVILSRDETLRSSYGKLKSAADQLFSERWPIIRAGSAIPKKQPGSGSYHRSSDKDLIWNTLPLGCDTPCAVVEDMGMDVGASMEFWDRYDREIRATCA